MGTWMLRAMKPTEYHFLIDDVSSFKYGIRVSTSAYETTPTPKFYDYDDVIGRDGSMTMFMGTYDNKEISFECSFVEDRTNTPQFWFNQYREIKNWIMSTNDNEVVHKLQVSNDTEWYMNIVKAEISECERTNHEVGSFTVTFTVEPFLRSVAGDIWYSLEKARYNQFYKCMPIWKIVNKNPKAKEFKIRINNEDAFTISNCYVNREYYIDSDLQVTYFVENNKITRTGRSGLEEWTKLQHGMNEINVSNGFEVLCKPRWRSL